jgi:hypothetical protein
MMMDETSNLNPTPEARLAMVIWSHEYAFEQRGGSMDFWRALDAGRKRIARDLLRGVARAAISHGRTLEEMAR